MPPRLHAPVLGFCVALALAATDVTAAAQEDPWRRLVSESDSIGPETPDFAPTPWTACAPGVRAADSLEVAGGPAEFLLARRSLRTRGYFTYAEPPAAGAGRFALRAVLCDQVPERPTTFGLERDGRWFYLVFALREWSTYEALKLRTGAGEWRRFLWDAERRTFAASREP